MTWYAAVPVTFVVGKGGVGSTTIAAAAAVAAARDGADVLFVSVDGRPGVGRLIGDRNLDNTDRRLRRFSGGGQIRGRTIPADDAFGDYLELKGVGGLLRRAASAASLPMIAAATPGLEHLLVLGKLKELVRERAADLIIVDAPPAGHAAPFLRSADGLADVVKSGPVLEQADEVREMLRDPNRTQAAIVTLPEETPVSEAIELAADVGPGGVGLHLAPVVLNGCWPESEALDITPTSAARAQQVRLPVADRAALTSVVEFVGARVERQRHQRDRLIETTGLEVVETPRLLSAELGAAELDQLADALADAASLDASSAANTSRSADSSSTSTSTSQSSTSPSSTSPSSTSTPSRSSTSSSRDAR